MSAADAAPGCLPPMTKPISVPVSEASSAAPPARPSASDRCARPAKAALICAKSKRVAYMFPSTTCAQKFRPQWTRGMPSVCCGVQDSVLVRMASHKNAACTCQCARQGLCIVVKALTPRHASVQQRPCCAPPRGRCGGCGGEAAGERRAQRAQRAQQQACHTCNIVM